MSGKSAGDDLKAKVNGVTEFLRVDWEEMEKWSKVEIPQVSQMGVQSQLRKYKKHEIDYTRRNKSRPDQEVYEIVRKPAVARPRLSLNVGVPKAPTPSPRLRDE